MCRASFLILTGMILTTPQRRGGDSPDFAFSLRSLRSLWFAFRFEEFAP